ncbi:hypothetical protein TNCV_3948761 [Trichonephila clavipes]|nr:hypothetical protein TNCV_3948761 [Trichonephila clavipes]
MNFRGVLNRLKPSEVIELETVYAVNIIDVMMEVLPYHDPHDVPCLWTQYAIPKLYFLVYKAWRRYSSQNLTTWTRLAQAVLDGCFEQKWPDCVFKCQTRVRFASARCTGRKRRNAAIHFTALPPPTLGCEPHVPPLQNTHPLLTLLDTALSPRKMGE